MFRILVLVIAVMSLLAVLIFLSLVKIGTPVPLIDAALKPVDV